jgi:uncharacterized delta-60 repeat protein
MTRTCLSALVFVSLSSTAFAAGQLDPAFDSDGVLRIDASPINGIDGFEAGLIDSAGRYVAAGRAGALDTLGGLVMRFQPSGQPDLSFGQAGKVRVPLAGGFGAIDWTEVVEQDDGRLIVAGRALNGASEFDPGRALVCRLLADGTLDDTYGSNGCTMPVFAPGSNVDAVIAAALQADGRLVLGGRTEDPGDIAPDYVVARFNIDGTPDACFGDLTCQTGGVRIEPEPQTDVSFVLQDLAIAPDGRIVLAGLGSGSQMAVIRLLPNGAVDGSGFGDGGHRLIAFDQGGSNVDEARAVVVRPNGSIVVAGTVRTAFGIIAGAAALDSFGAPDNSFGINGREVYFFNDVAGGHIPTGLKLQPDGKLLIVGYTDNDLNASPSFDDCGIARVLANGELDPTFGFNGVNSLDGGLGVNPTPDVCYDLGADGRHIVLFGASRSGSNLNSMLMRLDQDGVFADGFEASN